MTSDYQTEQEAFWAGHFGDRYSKRSALPEYDTAAQNFLSRALASTQGISSVLELGANVGLNLTALQNLFPGVHLEAVEINSTAIRELEKVLAPEHVHEGSFLTFKPSRKYDLVLCKGVLIHTDPDSLGIVYEVIKESAAHYILIGEYYNPFPDEVNYRGNSGKLFRRDFAGELLDLYPDLILCDYGFFYHRDQVTPQDDLTWFLLELRN